MRRLAILLSGRGSNFEAIADAVEAGAIPDAGIVAVVSDVPDARGLARAKGDEPLTQLVDNILPAGCVEPWERESRRQKEGEGLRILGLRDADRRRMLMGLRFAACVRTSRGSLELRNGRAVNTLLFRAS